MPFFHNRYVKFGALALFGLVALFVFWVLVNLMSSATGLDDSSFSAPMGAPAPSYDNRGAKMESADVAIDGVSYSVPEPTPSSYTSNLESYETTRYTVGGKVKEFDDLCQSLIALKADPNIHFQSINTQTNYCRAHFYVEEAQVSAVVDTLAGYGGVEISRDTSSVTRHRQQLQSRTNILQQQLARVEQTLAAAEAQLDRLNARFYATDEVTEISAEVTNSLRFIDQMTNQKINLISQLDTLYQQSADLEARLNVVEFSVNISRSNPLHPNKYERAWEQAWDELHDTFNETLIGITAFFGIFLLWALRISVYLLVVLIIVRLFWKFGRLLWNKW